MRIVIAITRSDTIGGAQTHVIELARGLVAKGWEVLVVVGGDGGGFSSRLDRLGVECIVLPELVRQPSLLDFKVLYKFRSLVRDFSPDVVSLHSVKAGLLGRLSLIGTGVPSVYTAHGWSHIRAAGNTAGRLYSAIESGLAKISARIICVCDADVLFAESELRITSSKILRIYNGVADLGTPAKSVESTDELPVSTVFGAVARFSHPKDYVSVIDALHMCADLDWRAEFVGDGDELDAMEDLCRQKNLQDRVRFVGFVEDVAEFYRKFDFLILSSFSEGLPCSIAEGFSCGTPAIASNVGGIPEMIQQGENGWLIGTQSAQCFAEVLREAATLSISQRQQMSQKARETYKRLYSLEAMIDETERVFRAVANKQS